MALVGSLATAALSQSYPVGQVSGSAPREHLGQSIAGAGDINGDGYPDVLVGLPGVSPGGLTFAGQARVYSGLDGTILYTLDGIASNESFGFACAGGVDFDGDGTPDMLVGAPNAVPGGAVRLFSGASGSLLLFFNGTAVGEELSHSIAALEDVTGDGVPEVLVGAWVYDGPGLVDNGRVRLFSGSDGAPLLDIPGASSGELLGSAVASLGDVDGDSFPDFAVGAPGSSASGVPGGGQVKLFSGSSGALLATLGGSNPNDEFGYSVAGIGDLDGDGTGDLAVGSEGADPGGLSGAGAVYLFSGAAGGSLFTIPGPSAGATLGSALAAIGDIDFDGISDLVAGARGATFGGVAAAGFVGVYSGATGSLLASSGGAAVNDQFGSSASGVGDVSGDGVSDFAGGAPGASPSGITNAGYAKVLSPAGIPSGTVAFGSGCAGSTGITPVITTMGGLPSASFGNPSFKVVLSRSISGTSAFLVVGSAPLFPPVDLGLFGSPGCLLYALPDLVLPAATSPSGMGAGGATITFFVPASPAMVGAALFLQWYVVDPGPLITPGATSRALNLVIQ